MAAVPGVRSRANAALPFRIDRHMVAGIALVGVSLAGGLVLWRGATDTTMVVVAARDIPPGHVIQPDDLALSEASVSGALESLALDEAELETAMRAAREQLPLTAVGGSTAQQVNALAVALTRPGLGSEERQSDAAPRSGWRRRTAEAGQ